MQMKTVHPPWPKRGEVEQQLFERELSIQNSQGIIMYAIIIVSLSFVLWSASHKAARETTNMKKKIKIFKPVVVPISYSIFPIIMLNII